MMHLTRRGLLLAAPFVAPARADEARELRVGQQFGIHYLSMIVARQRGLVEAHAARRGLPGLKVSWSRMGSGPPINDALISGSLDIGAGGAPPLLLIWSRTQTNARVQAVCSLGSFPFLLNTRNPAFHTVRDLGPRDRIAVPAIGVSTPGMSMRMAAEQAFGAAEWRRLDPITVGLPNPDATAALIGGHSEITGHFAAAPFAQAQLKHPGIRTVFSSYDVVGGPHIANAAYTTARFRQRNPIALAAFVAALDEANAFIAANPAEAARMYLQSEQAPITVDEMEAVIRDPANRFTTVPENLMKFAEFMARTGQLPMVPARWQDLFFPDFHDYAGS